MAAKTSPNKGKNPLKARSPSALAAKIKTGAGAHEDSLKKRAKNRAEEKRRAIEQELESTVKK